MAEAPTIKIVLDANGIDQIAAIIADLKRRNDELTGSLTAVQEVCDRQLEELRQLRRAAATQQGHICTACRADKDSGPRGVAYPEGSL